MPSKARFSNATMRPFYAAAAALARQKGKACRNRRTACYARHQILTKCAGQRASLSARSRVKGGSCWSAPSRAIGGGENSSGSRPSGQARHKLVALEHRALSPIFGKARLAGKSVLGLGEPGRSRGANRQSRNCLGNGAVACRTSATLGL